MQMGNITFYNYWNGTEIIREYPGVLPTLVDRRAPYILATENKKVRGRVIIVRGQVEIYKPTIELPAGYHGPEFGDEFNTPLPGEIIDYFRAVRIPYMQVSNPSAVPFEVDAERLQVVLDRLVGELDRNEDDKTGVIKSIDGGLQVSLMRYVIELIGKSVGSNIEEFLERQRRKERGPLGLNDITPEDIERLTRS